MYFGIISDIFTKTSWITVKAEIIYDDYSVASFFSWWKTAENVLSCTHFDSSNKKSKNKLVDHMDYEEVVNHEKETTPSKR